MRVYLAFLVAVAYGEALMYSDLEAKDCLPVLVVLAFPVGLLFGWLAEGGQDR
jgi:hypothetical protein